jgi:hypothetical protein
MKKKMKIMIIKKKINNRKREKKVKLKKKLRNKRLILK